MTFVVMSPIHYFSFLLSSLILHWLDLNPNTGVIGVWHHAQFFFASLFVLVCRGVCLTLLLKQHFIPSPTVFKIVFVVGNFTVARTGMFYVPLACDASILNIWVTFPSVLENPRSFSLDIASAHSLFSLSGINGVC